MLVAFEIDNVLYPRDEIIRDWLIENGFITSDFTVKQAMEFLSKQDALFKDFVFYSPEIYERRQADSGTVRFLNKIAKEGNEIIYVSKERPIEFKLLTEKWLKDFPANGAIFFPTNVADFLESEQVQAFFTFYPLTYSTGLTLIINRFQVGKVYEPNFKSLEKAYLFAKCTYNSTHDCKTTNFYN